MQKQKRLTILIFVFLFIVFGTFLFANRALALEVKYPVISGDVDLNTASNIALPDYVKYLFDLGIFLGFFAVFISMVWAGGSYIVSAAYPGSSLIAGAKERFSGAMTGLIILVTIYLVVTTINPHLSILSFSKKDTPSTPPPTNTKAPGIYFYPTDDCSGDSFKTSANSLADLGTLNNRVNSVAVVQDTTNNDYFVGVLYGNPGFSGKCVYLLPNQDCQKISSFGVSASVYRYDFDPNGDGVYFYKDAYFKEDGGHFKVSNKDIKDGVDGDVYEKSLADLKFTDPSFEGSDNPDGCSVPKEEQECIKRGEDGACTQRQCPSLSGNNISSIYIHGNYLALLIHIGHNDPPLDQEGPWTNCQEFPTTGDARHVGPKKLSWEPIDTNSAGLPNAVIILPIKK